MRCRDGAAKCAGSLHWRRKQGERPKSFCGATGFCGGDIRGSRLHGSPVLDPAGSTPWIGARAPRQRVDNQIMIAACAATDSARRDSGPGLRQPDRIGATIGQLSCPAQEAVRLLSLWPSCRGLGRAWRTCQRERFGQCGLILEMGDMPTFLPTGARSPPGKTAQAFFCFAGQTLSPDVDCGLTDPCQGKMPTTWGIEHTKRARPCGCALFQKNP